MKAVERLLRGASGKVFPAWQCTVSVRGETVFSSAGGDAARDSIFDLASLTKPLVTSALAMHFVSTDRLALDVPVADQLRRPLAAGTRVTPRLLLSHASGLPAWRPLFLEVPAGKPGAEARRAAILRAVLDTKPAVEPGTMAVYSDLNFLVLTALLEHLGGDRLDRLFKRHFGTELVYTPKTAIETEHDPARGVLAGRVNDENAFAMGGVAGHAGLFGTAEAVRAHVQGIVDAFHGRSSFATQQVVRAFWTRAGIPKGSTWALGWDTPSASGSSAGSKPPAGAVGHLGFTGTSVWIAPKEEIVVVLLTNRVWPDRSNEAIRAFRPRLHDAVWTALA